MKNSKKIFQLLKIITFWSVMILTHFLRAQNSQNSGQLFIQAFQGTKPVQGLEIIIDNKKYMTNSEGSLFAELGQNFYEAHFPQAAQKIKFEVFPFQETFMKIEVDLDGKLAMNIDDPEKIDNSIAAISRESTKIQNTANVEEYIVLAPKSRINLAALIEVRKQSAGVAEVLGSEQMSKQGDSDAASSLRRVTGLTLMNGKYVFVRGLGDRYSAVQLNGFSLPSPEPSRKVVPLDLFPTSVLESVLVQKSTSAFYPAEFGGGLIELNTKSLPHQLVAQVSMGQNLSDTSVYQTYQGDSSDWTGQDNGSRQLPKVIKQALASGKKIVEAGPGQEGYSKEELKILGQSLNKNYNLSEGSSSVWPSMQMSIGNQWVGGQYRAGVLGALSYSSTLDVDDKTESQVDVAGPNELVMTQNSTTQVSEIERKLSTSLSSGLDIGEQHQLRWMLLGIRHNTDTVAVKESSGSGVNDFSRQRTRTEWVERELFVQQLKGSHQWAGSNQKPVKLNWRFGKSQAVREAPDNKEYTYKKISITDPYALDPEVSGNLRTFSDLNEMNDEWGSELEIPINQVQLKVGFAEQSRRRESNTFRFQYVKDYLAGDVPDLTQSPDTIFSDSDNWKLHNQTGSADSYSGKSKIQAYASSLKWEPIPEWDLTMGYRVEKFEQDVKTFFYYEPTVSQSRGLNDSEDLLPSYSAVWKPNEKIRARLSYGESIARPDFRELSTVRYIDEETGYEAKGNISLQPAVLEHLDHRWEYYFKEDEYVSLGVFFKNFKNPIEDVFQPSAGSLIKVPQNARRAENQGFEFESRTSLRRISRNLRRFSVIANYTMTNSEVQLEESQIGNLTSQKRALQGQAPYVVNFQLQYELPKAGTQASLLYNVLGARITEVGTDQRPDIFEEPFHQVDFVYNQKWKKNVNLGFRARNLLDPKLQARQGSEIVRSMNRGRSLSFGVTWTL